jgi:hypothetical protein
VIYFTASRAPLGRRQCSLGDLASDGQSRGAEALSDAQANRTVVMPTPRHAYLARPRPCVLGTIRRIARRHDLSIDAARVASGKRQPGRAEQCQRGYSVAGPTLAAIYLGQITNWNDPAIAKLNPKVTFPNLAITPVHRADGSGDTYAFTDFLQRVSKTFQSSVGNNTTVNWPAGVGTSASNTGITAVQLRLAGGTPGDAASGLQQPAGERRGKSREGAAAQTAFSDTGMRGSVRGRKKGLPCGEASSSHTRLRACRLPPCGPRRTYRPKAFLT